MRVVGVVWVLKYSAKYGDAINCYDTEEAALQGGKEIVEDNLKKEKDCEQKRLVEKLLKEVSFYEAFTAWSDLVGCNEYIDIDFFSIYSVKTAIDDMKEAVCSIESDI